MTDSLKLEAESNVSRFYHLLKSYNNFNETEILGVIQSLVSPTQEESCFVATYYRARGNVETLLEITSAKHFQAASMLARGLFELAVDMRLLEMNPNAWIRMVTFNDVERLRCAREIVSFKQKNPAADVDLTTYEEFIRRHSARLDSVRHSVWPKMKYRYHWTGIDIGERATQVGPPMDRIYKLDYPRLSWYVHSGLTGILNLEAIAFIYICSNAFFLAAESYREIIEVIIRKFQMNKAIAKIDEKLFAAKAFPFNDDPEIEAWLTRSIQS